MKLKVLTLLFLLALADAAPKKAPKKGPSTGPNDNRGPAKSQVPATPLKGRPAKTHISPFPHDSDVFTVKNAKAVPRPENPKLEKPAVSPPKKHEKNRQGPCTTPECEQAAQELLDSMDLTVDPCDDFYAYTCGNWILNNPIPPTSNVMTMFNKLRDELNQRVRDILEAEPSPDDNVPVLDAKTMYSSCADTATLESQGLEPLATVMGMFGGWPMTLDQWGEEDFDWQQMAAAGIRQAALNTLISGFVGPDDMDTNTNVLYLDQSNLGLPGRDLYLEPSLQVILDAYTDLLKGTAKLVRDHHGSAVTDAAIEQEADEVIAFEVALAEIVVPDEDRLNYTELYNKLTLSSLQAVTDGGAPGVISWTDFLNAVFLSVGVTWGNNDQVVCYATDFMADLADLINRTPVRTIGNYLHWRLVYSVGDETNEAMRDLFFQFSQIVSGVDEPPERENVCASMVNSLMGMAVGSVYVSNFFPATAKQEVELLVADLKVAFEGILDTIDWMDAATVEKAREKNAAIRAFIGYPDFIIDSQALTEYYAGIIVNSQTHLSNIFSLLGWSWVQQAAGVNGAVDRDAWIIHPTIVNAFYYPSMNSITFPAGILQSPFYQKGRLAAMNYGGIGMVIGHEITHGFDNSGRQYDAQGNLVNWWTDATADAFVERAQCFIDQYDGYQLPELSEFLEDPHVNGLLTLGENIADNGGMREAWFAYLNYIDRNGTEPFLPGLEFLTPQQLVFLTFSYNWCGHSTVEYLLNQILNDPHSPPKFRVYGALTNNAAFAEAFGCTADDFMFNGDASCVIW